MTCSTHFDGFAQLEQVWDGRLARHSYRTYTSRRFLIPGRPICSERALV